MYIYIKFNKNVQYEENKRMLKSFLKNPVIKNCKNIFLAYFEYVYIFLTFFFPSIKLGLFLLCRGLTAYVIRIMDTLKSLMENVCIRKTCP